MFFTTFTCFFMIPNSQPSPQLQALSQIRAEESRKRSNEKFHLVLSPDNDCQIELKHPSGCRSLELPSVFRNNTVIVTDYQRSPCMSDLIWPIRTGFQTYHCNIPIWQSINRMANETCSTSPTWHQSGGKIFYLRVYIYRFVMISNS